MANLIMLPTSTGGALGLFNLAVRFSQNPVCPRKLIYEIKLPKLNGMTATIKNFRVETTIFSIATNIAN